MLDEELDDRDRARRRQLPIGRKAGGSDRHVVGMAVDAQDPFDVVGNLGGDLRSEEHTSELQSLMRLSYAVFCWKKKTFDHTTITYDYYVAHHIMFISLN